VPSQLKTSDQKGGSKNWPDAISRIAHVGMAKARCYVAGIRIRQRCTTLEVVVVSAEFVDHVALRRRFFVGIFTTRQAVSLRTV